MMRLMTTSWVLIVGLEPRWRWLLTYKASLSSLSDIGDVHYALAHGATRTSATVLSAHHYHGIEIVSIVDMVLWMPVLAILVVNG